MPVNVKSVRQAGTENKGGVKKGTKQLSEILDNRRLGGTDRGKQARHLIMPSIGSNDCGGSAITKNWGGEIKTAGCNVATESQMRKVYVRTCRGEHRYVGRYVPLSPVGCCSRLPVAVSG